MPYDFERNMTNHPPRDEVTIDIYEQMRAEFKEIARGIDNWCPDSREKTLALTNLEQSLMWAIASIARDGH